MRKKALDGVWKYKKAVIGQIIITGYSGDNADIVIPEKINGIRVSAIDDNVFANNKNIMRRWALQYALHAEVIAPEELVEQVREDVREAVTKYGV